MKILSEAPFALWHIFDAFDFPMNVLKINKTVQHVHNSQNNFRMLYIAFAKNYSLATMIN